MSSSTSADDRTPPQGQGVSLNTQQSSTMTLDQDLDGLLAAVEAGIGTAPPERVAGYLSRIQADVARLGLTGARELSVSLGRMLQALTGGGSPADAYALLPQLAGELRALAEHAPEGLADRLRRLAELAQRAARG